MVSKEGLLKFKALYKKNYGIELTDAEIFENANQFLNFYRAVFKEPANIKINYEQKIQCEKD